MGRFFFCFYTIFMWQFSWGGTPIVGEWRIVRLLSLVLSWSGILLCLAGTIRIIFAFALNIIIIVLWTLQCDEIFWFFRDQIIALINYNAWVTQLRWLLCVVVWDWGIVIYLTSPSLLRNIMLRCLTEITLRRGVLWQTTTSHCILLCRQFRYVRLAVFGTEHDWGRLRDLRHGHSSSCSFFSSCSIW